MLLLISYKINYKIQKVSHPNIMFSSKSSSEHSNYNTNRFELHQNRYKANSQLQDNLDLQNKARSNLCELSSTICQDHFNVTQKAFQQEVNHYKFSPWRPKNLEKTSFNLNKRRTLKKYSSTTQHQTIIKSKSNHINMQEQKSNQQVIIKTINQEDYEIKTYPSIFLKLKVVKQSKKNTKNTLQNHQIQIVTIMKRKKSQTNEIKKDILSEKIQNILNINKKVTGQKFILQDLNHTNLNKNVKQPFNTLSQFQNLQNQPQNKYFCLKNQHWKSKNVNIKNRVTKKANNKIKMIKSIQKSLIGKQTCPLKKRQCYSLQRIKRQDYQSNNPLTRLLYEKYINTINVNHH